MNKKRVKCMLILLALFLLFGCVNASSIIDDNEPVTDPAEPAAETVYVDTDDQDQQQDEESSSVTDQGEEQTEEKDEGSTEDKTPEESGKKPDGKDSGKKDDHDDDSGGGCVLTKVWVVDEPAETIQRYVVDQQEIGHTEKIWHDPVTHQEDVYEKVKKFSFELDDGYTISFLLSQLKDMGYDAIELAGLYGRSASEFRQALDAAGIGAISAHVPLKEIEADMFKTISDYRFLGCEYIAVPYTDPFHRPGGEGFAAALEALADSLAPLP